MKRQCVLTFGLIVTLATTGLSAHAVAAMNAFSPVINCGNGDFELDSMTYMTQTDRGGDMTQATASQLVLRNPQIIEYFEAKGAILPFEVNSRGEYIQEVIGMSYSTVSTPSSMNGGGTQYFMANDNNSGATVTAAVKGNAAYLTSDVLFKGNVANFYFPNCN